MPPYDSLQLWYFVITSLLIILYHINNFDQHNIEKICIHQKIERNEDRLYQVEDDSLM